MAFSYFFRDTYTLKILVESILPSISGRSKIRIWDAGCAMGQEAYTLAILLAERVGHFAFRNIYIDATDIDQSNQFEEIITNADYLSEDVVRIPRELLEKYFIPVASKKSFQIIKNLKNRVKFRKHDLLSLNPIGSDYSLVVCKNVLLHFKPEERTKVIKMFHRSLIPGGFLVMEQTQKLPAGTSHLFHQESSDVQLFRKVGA